MYITIAQRMGRGKWKCIEVLTLYKVVKHKFKADFDKLNICTI